MENEPITLHTIINGEKNKTEKNSPLKNPTHPDEIVGYASMNTKEDTVRAIDAAFNAFKGRAWSDVDDRIQRIQRAIQKLKDATPKCLSFYRGNMERHYMSPKEKLRFQLCGWNLHVICKEGD